MKLWQILIGIVVIVFMLIVAYAHTLKQIDITDISVYKLQVDPAGFTVQGHVSVYNGGLLPIDVQYIEYWITSKGNELARGKAEGTMIMPKKEAKIAYSSNVLWQPTAATALSMLEPGDTYATLEGNVVIDIFGIETKIPFKKEFNVEEYLRTIVAQKAQEWVQKAGEWVQKIF